eukprot:CAMPEP_0172162216 /NCGR_PEP_ID=MMETSP1050-20130122/6546_1 /TAXON_ID=233186 /ORGANISM="Cryptomonas curvata, Strain CCAP979/52" /LENGTH=280 /DNA_ID=CAMNT_0012832177 /DNA_START=51 /DNA_END=889 /DNA_ORIENTATION=-
MAVGGELQGCRCVRVACGFLHSAAITASGELFMWGCADGGRLGVGDPIVLNLPVSEKGRYAGMPMQVRGPLDGKFVVDVSCGNDVTMALLKCGEVYGWGVGIQTGQDDAHLSDTNAVPAALQPVTATPPPTCTWNGPDTRAAVFRPTKGPDGNDPNGTYLSITLIAQYRSVSFEELRAGDYMLARRKPAILAVASSGTKSPFSFGTAATAMPGNASSGGSFGFGAAPAGSASPFSFGAAATAASSGGSFGFGAAPAGSASPFSFGAAATAASSGGSFGFG